MNLENLFDLIWPNGVQIDASAKSPNVSSTLCDLDSPIQSTNLQELLVPLCTITMVHNTVAQR